MGNATARGGGGERGEALEQDSNNKKSKVKRPRSFGRREASDAESTNIDGLLIVDTASELVRDAERGIFDDAGEKIDLDDGNSALGNARRNLDYTEGVEQLISHLFTSDFTVKASVLASACVAKSFKSTKEAVFSRETVRLGVSKCYELLCECDPGDGALTSRVCLILRVLLQQNVFVIEQEQVVDGQICEELERLCLSRLDLFLLDEKPLEDLLCVIRSVEELNLKKGLDDDDDDWAAVVGMISSSGSCRCVSECLVVLRLAGRLDTGLLPRVVRRFLRDQEPTSEQWAISESDFRFQDGNFVYLGQVEHDKALDEQAVRDDDKALLMQTLVQCEIPLQHFVDNLSVDDRCLLVKVLSTRDDRNGTLLEKALLTGGFVVNKSTTHGALNNWLERLRPEAVLDLFLQARGTAGAEGLTIAICQRVLQTSATDEARAERLCFGPALAQSMSRTSLRCTFLLVGHYSVSICEQADVDVMEWLCRLSSHAEDSFVSSKARSILGEVLFVNHENDKMLTAFLGQSRKREPGKEWFLAVLRSLASCVLVELEKLDLMFEMMHLVDSGAASLEDVFGTVTCIFVRDAQVKRLGSKFIAQYGSSLVASVSAISEQRKFDCLANMVFDGNKAQVLVQNRDALNACVEFLLQVPNGDEFSGMLKTLRGWVSGTSLAHACNATCLATHPSLVIGLLERFDLPGGGLQDALDIIAAVGKSYMSVRQLKSFFRKIWNLSEAGDSQLLLKVLKVLDAVLEPGHDNFIYFHPGNRGLLHTSDDDDANDDDGDDKRNNKSNNKNKTGQDGQDFSFSSWLLVFPHAEDEQTTHDERLVLQIQDVSGTSMALSAFDSRLVLVADGKEISVGAVNPGQWHHIAVVCQRQKTGIFRIATHETVQVFLDRELCCTKNRISLPSNMHKVVFGRGLGCGMAAMQLWGHALDPDQVQGLYAERETSCVKAVLTLDESAFMEGAFVDTSFSTSHRKTTLLPAPAQVMPCWHKGARQAVLAVGGINALLPILALEGKAELTARGLSLVTKVCASQMQRKRGSSARRKFLRDAVSVVGYLLGRLDPACTSSSVVIDAAVVLCETFRSDWLLFQQAIREVLLLLGNSLPSACDLCQHSAASLYNLIGIHILVDKLRAELPTKARSSANSTSTELRQRLFSGFTFLSSPPTPSEEVDKDIFVQRQRALEALQKVLQGAGKNSSLKVMELSSLKFILANIPMNDPVLAPKAVLVLTQAARLDPRGISRAFSFGVIETILPMLASDAPSCVVAAMEFMRVLATRNALPVHQHGLWDFVARVLFESIQALPWTNQQLDTLCEMALNMAVQHIDSTTVEIHKGTELAVFLLGPIKAMPCGKGKRHWIDRLHALITQRKSCMVLLRTPGWQANVIDAMNCPCCAPARCQDVEAFLRIFDTAHTCDLLTTALDMATRPDKRQTPILALEVTLGLVAPRLRPILLGRVFILVQHSLGKLEGPLRLTAGHQIVRLLTRTFSQCANITLSSSSPQASSQGVYEEEDKHLFVVSTFKIHGFDLEDDDQQQQQQQQQLSMVRSNSCTMTDDEDKVWEAGERDLSLSISLSADNGWTAALGAYFELLTSLAVSPLLPASHNQCKCRCCTLQVDMGRPAASLLAHLIPGAASYSSRAPLKRALEMVLERVRGDQGLSPLPTSLLAQAEAALRFDVYETAARSLSNSTPEKADELCVKSSSYDPAWVDRVQNALGVLRDQEVHERQAIAEELLLAGQIAHQKWSAILRQVTHERATWGQGKGHKTRFWRFDLVEAARTRCRGRMRPNPDGSDHSAVRSDESAEPSHEEQSQRLNLFKELSTARALGPNQFMLQQQKKEMVAAAAAAAAATASPLKVSTSCTSTPPTSGSKLAALLSQQRAEAIVATAQQHIGPEHDSVFCHAASMILCTGPVQGKLEISKTHCKFLRDETRARSDGSLGLGKRWPFRLIRRGHHRRFNMRWTALEIMTGVADRKSYMFNFDSQSIALEALKLISKGSKQDEDALATPDERMRRSPATVQWVNGEISNLEYLMILNDVCGRTYNDLAQYPILPWVLRDYTSQTIDLQDPGAFRDLARPIGAQSAGRQQELQDKFSETQVMHQEIEGLKQQQQQKTTFFWPFQQQKQDNVDQVLSGPPWHFGTFYSSRAIVAWYLLRLEPFTSEHIALQGNKFDHADRQFHSVQGAFDFATGVGPRELTPEWFSNPEFLRNSCGFDLGTRQDGQRLGDVVLPPWASGSPEEFVHLHRQALESDIVSQTLHLWIDLTFGNKQRGPLAQQALNIYFHLVYEGAVDLDYLQKVRPDLHKTVTRMTEEYGQAPPVLFSKAHPPRVKKRKMLLLNSILLNTSLATSTKDKITKATLEAAVSLSPALGKIIWMTPLLDKRGLTLDKMLPFHLNGAAQTVVAEAIKSASPINWLDAILIACFFALQDTGTLSLVHMFFHAETGAVFYTADTHCSVKLPFASRPGPTAFGVRARGGFAFNTVPSLLDKSFDWSSVTNANEQSKPASGTQFSPAPLFSSPSVASSSSSVSTSPAASTPSSSPSSRARTSSSSSGKVLVARKQSSPASPSSPSSDLLLLSTQKAAPAHLSFVSVGFWDSSFRVSDVEWDPGVLPDAFTQHGRRMSTFGSAFAALRGVSSRSLLDQQQQQQQQQQHLYGNQVLLEPNLTVYKDHTDLTTCTAVSEDGLFLVTGSTDCCVCVFKFVQQAQSTGDALQLENILFGHDDKVTSVAVCAAIDLVVSASSDCVILHTLDAGTPLHSFAFTHDSAKQDKTPPHELNTMQSWQTWVGISNGISPLVNVWRQEDRSLATFSVNGRPIARNQNAPFFSAFCYSYDGTLLACASRTVLLVYDAFSLRLVSRSPPTPADITAVSTFFDRFVFVIGCQDGTICNLRVFG